MSSNPIRTTASARRDALIRDRLFPGLRSIVTALALGLGTTASAQVTSVNGDIAYVACETISAFPFSQCDIWKMGPDGSNKVNLTNSHDKTEFNPAWSSDGTKIAFIEGVNGVNTLWVMNADGSDKVAITPPSYQFGPTWSPGGTQIALTRQVPGQTMSIQFDIIVVNVDGSGERKLTDTDFDEFEPAWSPDGSKIAFAGVRFEQYPDPITGAPTQGAQWEIVTVNPDGSGEQILSAGDPNSIRAKYLEEDRGPSWSPDGSKLVFMSQAQVPACCGPWQIWAVNRDGTGATNLTNDDTVNDLYPTWSPDGTQILFSRATGSGGFDLYTMPAPTTLPLAVAATATRVAAATTAATGPANRLTTDGNASDPDWQRKGAAPLQFLLSVSVVSQGKGAGGSVNSSPAGIRCGRDCQQSYATATLVKLTATPKKGSVFAGWSGACTGISPVCDVTMNDVKTAIATFARSR